MPGVNGALNSVQYDDLNMINKSEQTHDNITYCRYSSNLEIGMESVGNRGEGVV